MKMAGIIAALFLGLLIYGCGGSSSSDVPVVTHQVVGAVTLPQPTDRVYTVYVDTDGDPGNGYVARYQHFCDCGDFVEYWFDGIPPGSYYIYATTTSVDGTQTYFGFYDPNAVITLPPADPNAGITAASEQVFDFTLAVM